MTNNRKPKFAHVVVFSGHMIDSGNRKSKRFPSEKESIVRSYIENYLRTNNIGSNDLAICGGASGGDIIFAELSLAHGSNLKLLLASSVEQFIETSVRPSGQAWVKRFNALQNHPRCKVCLPSHNSHGKESKYETTNMWMIQTAQEEAYPEKPMGLVVWDEKPYGQGKGGTSHFVSLMSNHNFPIVIINPLKEFN